MEYFIGIAVGAVTTYLLIRVQKFYNQVKQADLKESENRRLRQENEELKTKISQNAKDIYELKKIIPDMSSQILTCLEMLSNLTDFRDVETLKATYVASKRLRQLWGFGEKDSETFISKD